MSRVTDSINRQDTFSDRHIGPNVEDISTMLKTLGISSLEELAARAVPESIRTKTGLGIGEPLSESAALKECRRLASKNQVFKSWIGCGYAQTITPPVIQRNIMENPGWYTQYTPYQAEISQGRLEALLNFQTMVAEMTGLKIANASLLDEGTAAAEAMALCHGAKNRDGSRAFFISSDCHPQTINVVETRARAIGVGVIVGDHRTFDFKSSVFGMLLQYPSTDGTIFDYEPLIKTAHKHDTLVAVAADLLSLALIKSPGELGADMALGNSQRFGVPLGYGGPHGAFFATTEDFMRKIPGRIIGVSKDANGKRGYRLSLQTREQHIRREKATSNICTAQALLANMAGMYAVYHGPAGIKRIAERVHGMAAVLKKGFESLGVKIHEGNFFDTLKISTTKSNLQEIITRAKKLGVNFRIYDSENFGIALDETTIPSDVMDILRIVSGKEQLPKTFDDLAGQSVWSIDEKLARKTSYLTHPVFSSYHTETELMRYLKRLESRDLSLTRSMIPLGSCTMKLNAAAELLPVTWPEFGQIHPFAPIEQTVGYRELIADLEKMICQVTGFDAASVQPNSGAQGEFAGLLVIQKFHEKNKQGHRNICLIPSSAHGTNPASAAMAGMKVIVTRCDDAGNIDIGDLRAKAEEHKANLSALMVTYPSTHGVFETGIVEICKIIHANGGQVYMDGANLNAQLGLCKPGEFGPDVCHLNLHKTFAIPHGGGGPGIGPIAVKAHLQDFLPTHPFAAVGGKNGIGAISAAPWGSASILPISWMYMKMMGTAGLTKATQVAILNANYIAKQLEGHFEVLYRGANGLVAHECIVDVRDFKATTGIEVDDLAKRLIDYGFHAPTVSFPVPGTFMIEPTESESKGELDRFCRSMIAIRNEIREIESGTADRINNVLKRAPHSEFDIVSDHWDRPYGREKAAFPQAWLRDNKFWPAVSRIDNAFGDRNVMCTCPPVSDYE
jgi:glycine dehydrogenase